MHLSFMVQIWENVRKTTSRDSHMFIHKTIQILLRSALAFALLTNAYGFDTSDIYRLAKSVSRHIDKDVIAGIASQYDRTPRKQSSTDTRIRPSSRRLVFPINDRAIFNQRTCDFVYHNSTLLSCYDYDKKLSVISTYLLNGDSLRSGYIRQRPDFYPDPYIPKRYRAYPWDYAYSRFDRGHLRSHASTAYNKELLYDTYSMVNIAPQVPELNRKTWVKAEKYERLIARKLGSVKVYNICYFDPDMTPMRIGQHRVAIPDGFYKVLYSHESGFKRCFFYRNKRPVRVRGDRLKDHEVSCDKIWY